MTEGRRARRAAAGIVAAVAVLAAACGSEGDADATRDAAGEVQPGAAPDSLAATPAVPPGGIAGGRGTAGDNTGTQRVGSDADSARDGARTTPARTGTGGPRITPPDTGRRLPNPPPRTNP